MTKNPNTPEPVYTRLRENLSYKQALDQVMCAGDFSLAMRRMDELHTSTKKNVPSTQFLTKKDGILWRQTLGGGRPGRVGKGQANLWYLLDPAKPPLLKIREPGQPMEAEPVKKEKPKIIPPVIVRRTKATKAIPKSQLKKSKKPKHDDGLGKL